MPPWSSIQSKIKEAYDKIESAYNQIEIGVGEVKQHRILNIAVRGALSNIPLMGSYLLEWYDGVGEPEDDKAKEILQFLNNLQQQSEEQFTRISDDLKTHLNVIISSKIGITELISKTSTEILEEVHRVREDTTAIRKYTSETRRGVEEVKEILKSQDRTFEIRYAEKPPTFHGEKSIFIGRQDKINQIKSYFRDSNAPISIVGLGGI